MISSRYALPVAIVLSLALVPTIIHSYLNLSVDNISSSKSIGTVLGDLTSIQTQRSPTWGEQTFGCIDWFERIYSNQQGDSARLFVGRAYDHKRLYHHPELALSYGMDLRGDGQVILNVAGQRVPVNFLYHSTQPNIGGFALFYDGAFVANPIALQIKNSLALLVSPQKPMTIFYVSEKLMDKNTPFEKTLSAKVLSEAITSFLAQQPR